MTDDLSEDRRDSIAKNLSIANQRYALLLWGSMRKMAREVSAQTVTDYGYPAQPGETVLVFEGHMQERGNEVGIGRSATTEASRLLSAMRAITVLRRANRTAPSIVILSYEPTEAQFADFKLRVGGMSRRINPSRYDAMRDDLVDARARIKELETQVKTIENLLTGIMDKQIVGGS